MDLFEANIMPLDNGKQIYVIHLNDSDIAGRGVKDLDVLTELAEHLLDYINEKKKVEVHAEENEDENEDQVKFIRYQMCCA